MTKRFTHTEKYGTDGFINLSQHGKLMYYYLNDNCDHGGFYQVSLRHMEIYLFLSRQEAEHALMELDDHIVWSDDKSFIWLKNFLEEQTNLPLNKHNNAHKGTIDRIKKHSPKFQKNIDLFYNLPCEHKFKNGEVKNELLGEYLSINPGDISSVDITNRPETAV
jgi:hypothetical protein